MKEDAYKIINEEVKQDNRICPDCGGLIRIRNPTGICDHLYYTESKKPKYNIKNSFFHLSIAYILLILTTSTFVAIIILTPTIPKLIMFLVVITILVDNMNKKPKKKKRGLFEALFG